IPGTPPTRKDDGYIGYNPILPGNLGGGGSPPPPDRAMRVGGVILFDGFGRVINKFYGFHLGRDDATAKVVRPTLLAELVGYLPADTPPHYYLARQAVGGAGPMSNKPPQSLFGFVLFDAEPFRTLGFTDSDPEFDPAAGPY